jgi:hypothetical protein
MPLLVVLNVISPLKGMCLMWLLFACSDAHFSVSTVSDEEFYDESNWGNSESDVPTDGAEEDLGSSYYWWELEADLHLDNNAVNKEKSTVTIRVFSEFYDVICSVAYQLEEALLTPPSFEEGQLWWRMLLKEGEEGLQSNLCSSRDDFPRILHLGVGELHVESLAVWNDVSWGEISPPELDTALSSYISLDNGETIWVYGLATSAHSLEMGGINVLYLRPAYFFPMMTDG